MITFCFISLFIVLGILFFKLYLVSDSIENCFTTISFFILAIVFLAIPIITLIKISSGVVHEENTENTAIVENINDAENTDDSGNIDSTENIENTKNIEPVSKEYKLEAKIAGFYQDGFKYVTIFETGQGQYEFRSFSKYENNNHTYLLVMDDNKTPKDVLDDKILNVGFYCS